jgi:hypothetical protein
MKPYCTFSSAALAFLTSGPLEVTAAAATVTAAAVLTKLRRLSSGLWSVGMASS